MSSETVISGIAAVLSFSAIGMALARIAMSVGTPRSWAFFGLPGVLGMALLATAQFIGLERQTLAIVSGAAMVLCAISLVLLVRAWPRAA